MRNRPLMMVCILCLIIRYAVFLAGSSWEIPPELIKKDGQEVQITGTVYQREEREKGPTWYLDSGKRNYLIYDSEFRNLKIGNQIQVSGTFHLFETASNPGNFDSRSYYQRKQIYGSIIPKQITMLNNKISYWKEWLTNLRMNWKQELMNRMGEEKGAILSGILLGDKSSMEPETKELYQKNGIAHLLAVSGVCFLCWVFIIGERMA